MIYLFTGVLEAATCCPRPMSHHDVCFVLSFNHVEACKGNGTFSHKLPRLGPSCGTPMVESCVGGHA